jgi:hypothetical protein
MVLPAVQLQELVMTLLQHPSEQAAVLVQGELQQALETLLPVAVQVLGKAVQLALGQGLLACLQSLESHQYLLRWR